MFKTGQEVWIKYKNKAEKWTVNDPNYEFLGNKFIKLKKGNDFTLTTWDKIFLKKEDVK